MSPEMPTRSIGSSTIEASVVGLGTWAIGGWMWGGTDEADSVAADPGLARRGRLADRHRSGLRPGPRGGDRRQGDQGTPRQGGAGDEVRPRLAHAAGQSLLRLRQRAGAPIPRQGVDRPRGRAEPAGASARTTSISTSPTGRIRRRPIEETMETLVMLRDQGKIRSIGASNLSEDDLRSLCGDRLARRDPGGVLDGQARHRDDAAAHRGRGRHLDAELLLAGARAPLGHGWDRSGRSPATTSARDNPRFSLANRAKVDSPHGGDRARSPKRTGPRKAQVVIAWTLQQPGITFALCGARNPDQARENARAGRIRLSTDEVDAIERCRDDPSDEPRRLRRTRWSTRTEHRLRGRV